MSAEPVPREKRDKKAVERLTTADDKEDKPLVIQQVISGPTLPVI